METKYKKIYEYIDDNVLDMKKVMEDYTPYINRIINNYKIVISNEDAEEIILDVYLTIWKNKDKLFISNTFSPYIAGITRNLIKLKLRKIDFLDNIENYEDSLVDLSNIELTIVKQEEYKDVLNAIEENISKEDKEVFLAFYFNENSIKEIANNFKMKESKVKSKLFRIRKKIKKYLKSKEGFDYGK